MSGIEVRKIESQVHDTINNQYVPRLDTVYELGAEIDGAWVPFARVTEGGLAAAKARAEAERSGGTATPEVRTEPEPPQTMAELAPTPAPQAEAARQSEPGTAQPEAPQQV